MSVDSLSLFHITYSIIYLHKYFFFFFSLLSLIEEGGDWDRRNRLKVYQGLYCVAIRDFKQAAELFLDTVSTFTSYELMDYKTFVTYTVYVSMIALDRPDLREKVSVGSSKPSLSFYLHAESNSI